MLAASQLAIARRDTQLDRCTPRRLPLDLSPAGDFRAACFQVDGFRTCRHDSNLEDAMRGCDVGPENFS